MFTLYLSAKLEKTSLSGQAYVLTRLERTSSSVHIISQNVMEDNDSLMAWRAGTKEDKRLDRHLPGQGCFMKNN